MTRKTLTISIEEYNALFRAKGRNESLTEAILRLAGKGAKEARWNTWGRQNSQQQACQHNRESPRKKSSIHIRSAHEETVRKRQMTKVAEAMDRLRNRSEDSGWSGTREIRKWRDSRPKS